MAQSLVFNLHQTKEVIFFCIYHFSIFLNIFNILLLMVGLTLLLQCHSWALLIFLQAQQGRHVCWCWNGPFPLSFACHNTANIMAMSQMWFRFLPLQHHICCSTEMPLCGNALPWLLAEAAVLFIHFISQIWLVYGKLGFLVEKTWQRLPTNTSGCQAAICSSDWMTGLNAAVSTNRSSDRKANAPRFSNIIPFPYIYHQRRQQELKE